MRRSLWLPLWLLLLGSAPVRAGWVEERPDRTILHVTLHDWIFQGLDPARKEPAIRANAAALRAFEREFPAIVAERWRARWEADPGRYGKRDWSRVEVRVGGFSGLNLPGVETDLLAIAGEAAPDILYVNFRKSDSYIQQGFLHPLDRPEDGYLAALSPEEVDARLDPRLRPIVTTRGPSGRVHTWALPYGGAMGRVLWYRKDLFDRAGLRYPDTDWTWDDLLEACRRITDPATDTWGIALRDTPQESWRWLPFLWSAGGEVLAEDPVTGEWDVVFDSRAAAVGLDFYVRLCSEPWTDRLGRRRHGYAYRDENPQLALEKWSQGRIAMTQTYIDESVFSQLVQPESEGIAPVPRGPGGVRAGELNSRMMGLFAGIREPAVRDAAWEFIRYFESEPAQAIKTRVMVEGGLGRFVNPDLLEKHGYPELVRLSPRGWAETFREAIATGKPEPYKNMAFLYEVLDEPLKTANRLALKDRLPADPEARLDTLQGLLGEAAEKARRVSLGRIPEAERRLRRATGALFVCAMVGVFVVAGARAFRDFRAAGQGDTGWTSPARRRLGWWMLAPAGLSILVWQYVPLARGSLIAFQEYNLLRPSVWVGFENFGNVLWDGAWWTSVWNAVRYSALVVALTFLPPLLLAVVLQEIPRGKLLYRTVYYLPAALNSLVVIYLWKTFYGETEVGLLNRWLLRTPAWAMLLLAVGLAAAGMAVAIRLWRLDRCRAAAGAALIGWVLAGAALAVWRPVWMDPTLTGWAKLTATLPHPVRWLRDDATAMFACVLPLFWAGVGPGCLIYLAALKNVPEELYESADLDGAGFLDKLLFIVLPLFRPLLAIQFLGVFIGAWFHSEANILAMTGGGAGTRVAGLEIFYRAFTYLQFGPATAMAWMLGFMLVLFTLHQLKTLARVEFRRAGDGR
jgi:multiple sugar transport system permease protein